MLVPLASGLNANRLTVWSLRVGCDKAQMITLFLPLDETLVRKPPNCPPPIEAELLVLVSAGLRAIPSFHTSTVVPPLLTTRPIPSRSTKKEGPHQQAPTV